VPWFLPDTSREAAQRLDMTEIAWMPIMECPDAANKRVWVSCLAKGAAAVPVYSDCMKPYGVRVRAIPRLSIPMGRMIPPGESRYPPARTARPGMRFAMSQ